MARWLIIAVLTFALTACGGGDEGGDAVDGEAFGVPDCSEFVDGQPVPTYSLTEADDGGPGASCFNSDANSLVLSAVWDCSDGSSFVGRDDGYFLSRDGTWRDAPDDDPERQNAFWQDCMGS